MTTPADQLRAAAGKLRALGTAVGHPDHPGLPWHTDQCGDKNLGECPCIVAQGRSDESNGPVTSLNYIADTEHPDLAAYIATMHPGVGLALVDWLESTALTVDAVAKKYTPDPGDHWIAPAVAVARQVLGATTEQPETAPVCVHPEHYEGECPCPPSCICCQPTFATTEQPVAEATAVDRAAILREAWDMAHEEGSRLEEVAGIEAARGARCVAHLLRRLADEAQQPAPAATEEVVAEDESCGRFVPDAPRAPGLCASCGDARGWHSREAVGEQQPTPAATCRCHSREGLAPQQHENDCPDAIPAP